MLDQDQLLKAILHENLRSYTHKVFVHLEGNRSYLSNWHINALLHQMERVISGESTRLIINLPPRHLKSLCVSVVLPTWLLGHDPSIRIMCLSYSDDLTRHFSIQCRQIMESRWYREIFTHTRIDQSKKTQAKLATTKGGYRLAKSISGGFTGWGADYIIIDDPIKTGGAMSKAERDYVNDQFDSAILSRLNDKKTGRVIIAMQRVHGNDLTGHVLRNGAWDQFSLPAIAQKDMHFKTGPNSSYIFKKGQALHPEREDLQVLNNICTEIGKSNFQTQYLQEPAAAHGNYIKEEWFSRFRSDETIYYDEIIQSWDTASKTGDSNCFSVCTTWAVKGERFYLIDVHRGRYEFPELEKKVKAMNEKWNPNYILVEDASSGIPLGQILLRKSELPIIIRKTKLDKETRLQEASFFIEREMVWLPDQAKWLKEFLDEVLSFPNSDYNDQVDSMTQFLLFMRDQMPVGEGSVVTPVYSEINSPNLDLSELY